ncbi:glycoside hydrolase family 75 protein [Planosporangium sp. 12N6]|uniref:glycoside hydrolase family 75 protein n=1 Tax=Planosporangium spinosum TaxID=3402278 RepID=UPI003CF8ED2C
MRLLHLVLVVLAVMSLPPVLVEPVRVAHVTADDLLGRTRTCTPASVGGYTTYDGTLADVPVCKAGSAYFWKAGMGIDCDGPATTSCNARTDPSYQSQTLCVPPDCRYLTAEETYYLVIPMPSARFDYRAAGIRPGDVGAVVYGKKVVYAVFADVGPEARIGEASYAAAKALGINPDPALGGASSGVTYIVFPGQAPDVIGDNAAAHQAGASAAHAFVHS